MRRELWERPVGFRRCPDSGNVAPIGERRPADSFIPNPMTELVPASLLTDIRRMIDSARARAAAAVNAELTLLYWQVGRRIRDDVLGGERAGYGQQILPALARQLRAEYGRGWSEQQLRHCIRAAEVFPDEPILSALRRELSWTHLKMLADGERWTYQPAPDHEIAWLATNAGRLHAGGAVLERELAVFAAGHGVIDIVAQGAAEFVIGSAVRHPHPLVSGSSSVHTSMAALAEGERTIVSLQRSAAFAALAAH